MDDVKIDRLEELQRHLQVLIDNPEMTVDAKLFDDVELQVTPSNTPQLIPSLLPQLSQILLTTPHDPTAIVSLTLKLIAPISFAQALTLASEDSLVMALSSPAPAAAILALTILSKASNSPSDAAILSIMSSVVSALIRTWLSSPSVEVGGLATHTLGDLLEVDSDKRSPGVLNAEMNGGALTLRASPNGQGLLWRRIFSDKDIYRLFFELCSSQTVGTGPGELDERQKSLAQARLLRILPRLASLDFSALSRSYDTSIEERFGLRGSREQCLLYWASVRMVDKSDVLMHITLIDSFAELIKGLEGRELGARDMAYLKSLVGEVTKEDESMARSLQSLGTAESSSEELLRLLNSLNLS